MGGRGVENLKSRKFRCVFWVFINTLKSRKFRCVFWVCLASPIPDLSPGNLVPVGGGQGGEPLSTNQTKQNCHTSYITKDPNSCLRKQHQGSNVSPTAADTQQQNSYARVYKCKDKECSFNPIHGSSLVMMLQGVPACLSTLACAFPPTAYKRETLER